MFEKNRNYRFHLIEYNNPTFLSKIVHLQSATKKMYNIQQTKNERKKENKLENSQTFRVRLELKQVLWHKVVGYDDIGHLINKIENVHVCFMKSRFTESICITL